ncbi:MAG: hypothetical protein ACYSUJ_14000 [Planctomycetota bacterium]
MAFSSAEAHCQYDKKKQKSCYLISRGECTILSLITCETSATHAWARSRAGQGCTISFWPYWHINCLVNELRIQSILKRGK